MYRKCYSNIKVTFSRLSHKRLTLHIPDADDNVIPYQIYPAPVGNKKILKAKRLTQAVKLCTGELETVADKLRYARLTAGFHQDALADKVGIDRITLLRYENGHISEETMEIEWLIKIALECGMEQYFCCSPYHIFIIEDAGKQIKQYRRAAGLTQKKLAAKLGVAETTVKRWEQKRNKPPKYVWELVNGFKPVDM